jgi:hypothetical protein
MFGYFESDDLDAAGSYLAAQEVNRRWQDAMADLLEERVPDGGPLHCRRFSDSIDAGRLTSGRRRSLMRFS